MANLICERFLVKLERDVAAAGMIAGSSIYRTGCRNVPLLAVLNLMEHTRSAIVLETITAIAVIALVLYVLFGPAT